MSTILTTALIVSNVISSIVLARLWWSKGLIEAQRDAWMMNYTDARSELRAITHQNQMLVRHNKKLSQELAVRQS